MCNHVNQLPSHLSPSITAYIERGRPVGGFLEALISNDLFAALNRADSTSVVDILDIARYFYNHAPALCYGSPEKYKAWLKAHREYQPPKDAEQTAAARLSDICFLMAGRKKAGL